MLLSFINSNYQKPLFLIMLFYSCPTKVATSLVQSRIIVFSGNLDHVAETCYRYVMIYRHRCHFTSPWNSLKTPNLDKRRFILCCDSCSLIISFL